jgi:hypothetical protein
VEKEFNERKLHGSQGQMTFLGDERSQWQMTETKDLKDKACPTRKVIYTWESGQKYRGQP